MSRFVDDPISLQVSCVIGRNRRTHAYEGDTTVSNVSRGRAQRARRLVAAGGAGRSRKGSSRAKTVAGKGKALQRVGIAVPGRGKASRLLPNTTKKLTTGQVAQRTIARRKLKTRATGGGRNRTRSILRKARAAGSGRARPLPLGQ